MASTRRRQSRAAEEREMTQHEDFPRWVRVSDREDVGEVIQPGKNLGSTRSVYCYVIYFPDTGECRFYNARRITRAEAPE